jgi:predicted TIM-barrel fold metal-dependent hydrolase
MWDPGKCLEEFRGLGLSEEENELILYKNALEIIRF